MTDYHELVIQHPYEAERDAFRQEYEFAKRESDWQTADTAPLAKKVLAWWIPVDGNPFAETIVIAERCDVEKPHPDEGLGAYEPGCWWANGRYYGVQHITHWRPLPADMPAESKRMKAIVQLADDNRRRGSE